MTCETCQDMGLYQDDRCKEKTCAHAKKCITKWKWVTVTSPNGQTGEKQIPAAYGGSIMPCPQRTCLCPAGKRYKRVPSSPGKKGWRLVE